MILAAFVPVFLWMKYFHERTGASTPRSHVVLAFLAGLAVAYPAIEIETFLATSPAVSFAWLQDIALVQVVTLDGTFGHYFVRAYVIGGFVEEGLKLLALLGVLYAVRNRLRPVSLIVIAVALGGAFAAVENMLYTLGSDHWGRTAVLRALVSVPGHVFLAVIMGFFLALAWKWRWRYAMCCLALLIPVLLHGSANYALAVGAPHLSFPGEVAALGRQAYGAILLTEAVLARLVLSRVPWLRTRLADAPSRMVRGRRYNRLRRAFWGQVAMIIGVFGLVMLSAIIMRPAASFAAFSGGTTFLVGALSLAYAIAIWGHARKPALRPVVRS